MSHYEMLPLIQQSLNCIIDKRDIENIILLFKLSLLIQNTNDEDYIKLFILNYLGLYNSRIEFINGIKCMDESYMEELKNIMINCLESKYGYLKDNPKYRDRYYERRNTFRSMSHDELRKMLIEELLNGINISLENVEKLIQFAGSIDYNEQKRLNNIYVDNEIEKLKEKTKHKYTEDGNFADDENILNIVTNNLRKKGYTSHHLHIYVYEEIDKIFSSIITNQKYQIYKSY